MSVLLSWKVFILVLTHIKNMANPTWSFKSKICFATVDKHTNAHDFRTPHI